MAAIQLRKILNQNPKLIKGYHLLALIYIHKGEYEKARKILKKAAKIDKTNSTTLRFLKEVDFQTGTQTSLEPRRFGRRERTEEQREDERERVVSGGLPVCNLLCRIHVWLIQTRGRYRLRYNRDLRCAEATVPVWKSGVRFLPIHFFSARRKTMVLGELGLDGHVQEISGVFPAAAKARELGCTTLLVPAGNAAEGGLVGGLHVVGIQNLQELLNYCCEGKMPSLPSIENQKKEDGKEPDFSEVQGQTAARRAALIAAAGFHNLLMLGPPGSGKSMIARRIPTIMPPMSEEEQMEVTRIYSIAGMLAKGEGVRRERPFRAPHHTMSPQALAGGGKQPSPGEITLAHRGVLFLDELPEMTRTTIEILRQPLEEHRIVISRVSGNYVFPASFLMVAAMNPCPCGFYPDLSRCTCAPGDISRYLSRVSQPFLDRMDLCVQVEALSYEDLHGEERCESSAKMREKATAAAEIQAARYRQESIHFNSELKAGQIEKYCILEKAAEELLEDAFRRLRLSARSYHGIIRTARTIADLDGAVKIGVPHISEAICFRSADKSIWRI